MEYSQDIEEILDHFNFSEVKQVMDHLHWLWFDTIGVPEIADLRQAARRLLSEVKETVIKNKEFTATSNRATGGFRAEAFKYADDDKIYMRLAFEVTEWSNFE